MMMFYRCRASAKHRYDIIEVDYGGGGHRTRLRDQEINLCVYGVPPAPVYKGGVEEEGRPQGARPRGGILLLVGVGFPLLGRATPLVDPLLLPPLYTEEGGTP